MISVLQIGDSQLTDAVLPLCEMRLPVPLAPMRAQLMLHLLMARRDLLLDRLTSP